VTGRWAELKIVFQGAIVGNLGGVALFGFGVALTSYSAMPRVAGSLSLPSLLLAPFLVGFIAAWYWRKITFGIRNCLLYSLLTTCLAFAVAALLFREGFICLLILAPIFYVAVLTGALVGRLWFDRRSGRINAFIFPMLFVIVLGEPALRGPRVGVVTDEIRIAASPVKVWPHVLAFDEIPDRPNYWLFHLGLPYPVRTTTGGSFTGADRACEFSGDAIFKERIAEFEPQRLLTFEITEMPRDPELIGHLDAHRGQFELIDNHDGTTTLIGRTWYSLHVRPAFYFDWWTHDIFRAVHLRVMRHVQNLAEKESAP
jgi:hypothetical protein